MLKELFCVYVLVCVCVRSVCLFTLHASMTQGKKGWEMG